MPCHSDYPKLSSLESELTMIYNIYDDLKGTFKQLKYPHSEIYKSKSDKAKLDKETRILCKYLQEKTKTEITNLNYISQRWWLNHQISDFKRMVKESNQDNFKREDYSNYEIGLIYQIDFLNSLIEDAFNKIEKRFDHFNTEQNIEWQKNITRSSFVQAMSSFELFSELIFLKTSSKSLNDTLTFKEYDKSNIFWKDTLGQSFEDWISFTDQFELKRYFEKYIHLVDPTSKARTYFEALQRRSKEGKNLIFTINDSKNLIKILRVLKNTILKKINNLPNNL